MRWWGWVVETALHAKDEGGVKEWRAAIASPLLIAFAAFHLILPHSPQTHAMHQALLYHMLLRYSRLRTVWMEGFAQQSPLYFLHQCFRGRNSCPLSCLSPPPHHFHRSFSHGPSSEEVGTCSRRGGLGGGGVGAEGWVREGLLGRRVV